MRNLNITIESEKAINFIRDYVTESGFSNVVLGLSGGVDSALSATLAVQALGRDNVYGVMLPCSNSSARSYDDALTLARKLGIHHERIDISPMADPYFDIYDPTADCLRVGNWLARTRMCVLYDLSAKYKALVVGTSNRTELLVGYFTQHGDGACAFEPIGHLYKSEVWLMAEELGVPMEIVKKTPTADLWTNQTDEGELGMTYSQLDMILHGLTEDFMPPEQIHQIGIPMERITRVIELMKRTEYKRNLPPLLTDWHPKG
jgi:NAD+ synthase